MGNNVRRKIKARNKNAKKAKNDTLICATRLISAGYSGGYKFDPDWFVQYRAQKLGLV
jgi:hypothetical protein